ncbi:MAG: VWA domain-containing protein [Myxococcota bacterium]
MKPVHETEGGRLAANIGHFGRLLRRAGIPVGPGAILDAIQAVDAVGIRRRDDVYWALHAVFVRRRDQDEIFEEAFNSFFRDPFALNQALALLLPRSKGGQAEREKQRRRLSDAWQRPRDVGASQPREEEIKLDAALSASPKEVLKAKDFEQMSADEIRRAKDAIAKMHLAKLAVPSRRFRPTSAGSRVDLRATVRASLRGGGRDIPLRLKERRVRPTPLVVLCDISGSMGRYSRMLLHFMHALTNDRDRVHSFVFGTRFTNVTRALRHKDVDEAFEKMSHDVPDWEGGTRIGQALRVFNQTWSRRVLGQGAVVLLITDGLERDDPGQLSVEMERLHKSCRRLVWLNPLLRYERFEVRAGGVRAMHAHIDDFLPVHNLQSLEQLAEVLNGLS